MIFVFNKFVDMLVMWGVNFVFLFCNWSCCWLVFTYRYLI